MICVLFISSCGGVPSEVDETIIDEYKLVSESQLFKDYLEVSSEYYSPFLKIAPTLNEKELDAIYAKIKNGEEQIKISEAPNSSNYFELIKKMGYSSIEQYESSFIAAKTSYENLIEEFPFLSNLKYETEEDIFMDILNEYFKNSNLNKYKLSDCVYNRSYCTNMARGYYQLRTGGCALSVLANPFLGLGCQLINAGYYNGALQKCADNYQRCISTT